MNHELRVEAMSRGRAHLVRSCAALFRMSSVLQTASLRLASSLAKARSKSATIGGLR
jgi:hypothetical protein